VVIFGAWHKFAKNNENMYLNVLDPDKGNKFLIRSTDTQKQKEILSPSGESFI
jgi:hypothetical protein